MNVRKRDIFNLNFEPEQNLREIKNDVRNTKIRELNYTSMRNVSHSNKKFLMKKTQDML